MDNMNDLVEIESSSSKTVSDNHSELKNHYDGLEPLEHDHVRQSPALSLASYGHSFDFLDELEVRILEECFLSPRTLEEMRLFMERSLEMGRELFADTAPYNYPSIYISKPF